MIEFLIVLPIFLLLLLSVLEFGLIYRAKFTLNHAAQQVARSGSLNNACMGAMDEQLVRSLTPLYQKINPTVPSYLATQAIKANTIKAYTDIDILFPTIEVFNRFKQKMSLYDSDISDCAQKSYKAKPYRPYSVLPNDNLQHRSDTPESIRHSATSIDMNIQDANLLRIELKHCHRLYFPVIDFILDSIKKRTSLNPADSIFYNNCINGAATDFNLNRKARYLILSSIAVARMQTPIFQQALKEK